MIPALLLEPGLEPHMSILDMCAAPGSKTEQLLNLLSASARGQSVGPSGMVVGNDADPKRMKTLRARYDRLGHPCLLLTCLRGEDLQHRIGNL